MQHAYAAFEAATGQSGAAVARLRLARDRYLAIGALHDAARIEEELQALQPGAPEERSSNDEETRG